MKADYMVTAAYRGLMTVLSIYNESIRTRSVLIGQSTTTILKIMNQTEATNTGQHGLDNH